MRLEAVGAAARAESGWITLVDVPMELLGGFDDRPLKSAAVREAASWRRRRSSRLRLSSIGRGCYR